MKQIKCEISRGAAYFLDKIVSEGRAKSRSWFLKGAIYHYIEEFEPSIFSYLPDEKFKYWFDWRNTKNKKIDPVLIDGVFTGGKKRYTTQVKTEFPDTAIEFMDWINFAYVWTRSLSEFAHTCLIHVLCRLEEDAENHLSKKELVLLKTKQACIQEDPGYLMQFVNKKLFEYCRDHDSELI